MTRIPDDHHYALNRAARLCLFDEQDFRLLVGAFEKRGGPLPRYPDEQGKSCKRIPASMLYLFERAIMWMKLEGLNEEDGMARVFEDGRRDLLEQLAQALNDTLPMRYVPEKLEKKTTALLATVEVLEKTTEALKTAALRPRKVSVNVADESLIADALANVSRRYQSSLLTSILLGGLLLGGGGTLLFAKRELHTQAQQIQRLQKQAVNLERRLNMKLDRIERAVRR